MPRGGLGAEDALAPFDDVEVDLEDPALVHHVLDHDRNQRFLALAPRRALTREEQVLRELLRDGRATRDDPALATILLARLLDRLPVEALMIHEARVFRDHDRALEVRRDARVRDPGVLEARARIALAHLLEPGAHECGGIRIVVLPPP